MVPWLSGRLCFASVAACSALFAWVGSPALAAPETGELALSIQRATLDNGLRVVLNPDPSAPNVAVCVTYDVGSRSEEPGRSGFAHLFEHMMFQGSGRVKKGQHFTLITARGGTLNGTTSTDRTNYFEVLPAGELGLALFLEADRMKSLAVTAQNMENQRAVVQEEYRMRVSNQAYAAGMMRLRELAFEGYFPYGHDPIGSMSDLDLAKLEYVAAFHRRYYAPDNAVLAIAGAFDPDRAMEQVREFFGDAVKRPSPPRFELPPLPPQAAARRAEVTDSNAKYPALLQAWTIPPHRTPEHYALELATLILGGGESARLHQELVRGSGKAQSVGVWTYDQRGPDLFVIRTVLSAKGKLPDVERTLEREVERLGTAGVGAAELDKAKTRLASMFVFGLETNEGRAKQLAEFELYWGDARLLARELPAYLAVTAEQVRDAVKKYLTRSQSSTVHVLPPAPSKPEGAAAGRAGDRAKEGNR